MTYLKERENVTEEISVEAEPPVCTCPGACELGMGALGVCVAILAFNAFFFGLLVLCALLPEWLR